MSKTKLCEKPCDTCEKKGLPLLLARYAILPREAHAPALSGNLNDKALAGISLGGNAVYGLRLLRSGYVYLYDDRGYWEEYFVTSDGFLTKLPPRPNAVKSQSVPPTTFACARNGAAPLAGVITIRNAKHAKAVWIGFSNVAWTDATFKKHGDAAYRARHMTKITISGGKVGPQARTAPIDRVDKDIPEFALSSQTVKKTIGAWTPFPFNARLQHTNDFKAAMKKADPLGGGAIVALMDPVGITVELDALMTHNLNWFINQPTRHRPLAVSQAIMQLKEVVRAQAVAKEEVAAQKEAILHMAEPDPLMLIPAYQKKKLKQAEEIRDVSPAEAKKAADRAWAAYSRKFDEPAMTSWRKEFDEDVKGHDRKFIAPLAEAHRDWMKSEALQACFDCNHDTTNIESGAAFAMLLGLCIGGTQDKGACFELYQQWLSAKSFDKGNMILRALALNQTATEKAIKDALQVSLDWRGFPLDALVASFNESVKSVRAGLPDIIGGSLIVRLMGPLASLMEDAADGKVRPALAMIGAYTGKGFAVVEVTGSRKAFRERLIRELVRMSGQPVTAKQMQRAVAEELRRLRIAGEKLDGTTSKRFLVMADPAHIQKMPATLDARGRAKWLATSIRTPQQAEAIDLAYWRDSVRNPGAAYIAGLAGALLQFAALQMLEKDVAKAMRHEAEETRARLRAGMLAFWGTVVDLTGQGLEKLTPHLPKAARGLGAMVAIGLQIGGKLAGLFGAGIMAFYDVKKALASGREGNKGLAALYFSSAFFGFSAAALLLSTALFAWAGPIAFVFIVILLGVAVLIEYLKDNTVQAWLSRCWWGKGRDAKYRDLKTELHELKQAMAG